MENPRLFGTGGTQGRTMNGNILTQHGPYLAIPLAMLRQLGPDLAAVACYVVNQVQLADGPVAITLEAMSRDLKIPERSLKRLIPQMGQIGLTVQRVGYPARNVFSVDFDVLDGILSRGAKMAQLQPIRGAKMAYLETQRGQNGPNEGEPSGTHSSNWAGMAGMGEVRAGQSLSRGAKMAQLETAEIAGPESRPGRDAPEAQMPVAYINRSLKETDLKEKELGGVSNYQFSGEQPGDLRPTPKAETETQQPETVIVPHHYQAGRDRMAGQVAEDTITAMGLGALMVNFRQASGVGRNQWHAWLSQIVMPYQERLGSRFRAVLQDAMLEALPKPQRYMLQDVVKVLKESAVQSPTTGLESPGRGRAVLGLIPGDTPRPKSDFMREFEAMLDELPVPAAKRSN